MYERFTDRARKVMQLANQEAQRFNHEYIGTEHILLGLILEGPGVAANVLQHLAVDPRKVRREVEKVVPHGPNVHELIMGRRPQTPRAKKVIEYSIEEARRLCHNYIGTEHLLLGLLREVEGVAAQVLMNFGLTLEAVREELLKLLEGPFEEPVSQPTIVPSPKPNLLTHRHREVIDALMREFRELALEHLARQETDVTARFSDAIVRLHSLLKMLKGKNDRFPPVGGS
jgi:ATP-dependent Clp protease ATP-binding subunit ClpA